MSDRVSEREREREKQVPASPRERGGGGGEREKRQAPPLHGALARLTSAFAILADHAGPGMMQAIFLGLALQRVPMEEGMDKVLGVFRSLVYMCLLVFVIANTAEEDRLLRRKGLGFRYRHIDLDAHASHVCHNPCVQ